MAPNEQGFPGAASVSGRGAVVSLQSPRRGLWGGNRHIEMCPHQSSAEGVRQGQGVSLVCCTSSPRTKEAS